MIQKVIHRPHLFFLWLIPIILLAGLINRENSILFNLHDIYLLMDVWYMSILSAIFFGLVCINYYILTSNQKRLNTSLTKIHLSLQILVLIPLLFYFFTPEADRSMGDSIDMNMILGLSFFIFLLATIIHFINFFISLLRKKQ